jgi:uncharacterized protein
MDKPVGKVLVGAACAALGQAAVAGTDIFFNPLTQSSAVATTMHINEVNTPWQTPAGLSQVNLTSLKEAEADATQSLIRVPGAGTSASMFDMVSYSGNGRYLFIPHETPWGAGVSRYNVATDKVETIFQGDLSGMSNPPDWNGDYAAFDPSTWTTHNTLFLAEEWSGEGRVIEIVNPLAPVGSIQYRELESVANVAHEGLRFSRDEKTLYFIDEYNSGSIYKLVLRDKRDYTKGQTFVLVVDAYAGDPRASYNQGANVGAARTGLATWVPITDKNGIKLTATNPFLNGPPDEVITPTTRGGRGAADEVNGTPYGRPEDMEVGRLANGREVVYFTATSEQSIYSIEVLAGNKAIVRLAANRDTPRNVGFPATTGIIDSPDNLAQDALGNIYVIEDWPNGSDIGGDIWFLRDANTDGVAESLDHFMSIQVNDAEATGMIFNPAKPTEFVVAVQHPASVDTVGGLGDALWKFDLSDIAPPVCSRDGWRYEPTCTNASDYRFIELLKRAGRD